MHKTDVVEHAVTLLYEAVLDDSKRAGSMAAFARAFDAPQATRMRFDFDRCELSEFYAHGHDAGVLARYAGHYHAIDPGGPPAVSAPVGRWLGDEVLFDRKARHQQEYAVDFALPSGIGWQAGGKVEATGPRSGLWFGVTREPDAPPFGIAGERVFQRMFPHLQQVARLESRLKQLAQGQSIAQASLDVLTAAVCVVDARRHALVLNRRAEQLLMGILPLSVRTGRLMCSSPALDERLTTLVHKACGHPARPGAFSVPRQDTNLTLQVMVIPLPQRHPMSGLKPQPLAMVVAADPLSPHLTRETYQGLFGLTGTEAGLLYALAQGESMAQWADARGVSINTARTHLSAVFAKVGVDTQARLLRVTRTLPSSG